MPTETVAQRCSVIKVLLEISQNSPENTENTFFTDHLLWLLLIRVPTCQVYKCLNKTGIDADSVTWCFAASTSQKSKANKFIEVFDYDGVKCYFDLSCQVFL